MITEHIYIHVKSYDTWSRTIKKDEELFLCRSNIIVKNIIKYNMSWDDHVFSNIFYVLDKFK